MTSTPGPQRLSASSKRTILLASFGGALEYYDFIVYGIFAAEIARAIFPASSPLVSLMASFGAFAGCDTAAASHPAKIQMHAQWAIPNMPRSIGHC